MKSAIRIFLILLSILLIGCNKEVSQELEINTNLFNISGEAQTFTFEITSNSEWNITTSKWIHVSQSEGKGSCLISVSVEENLYEYHEGNIIITCGNQKKVIFVKQNNIFNITTEDVLLREFYGYEDCYELYEERIKVTISPDINDNKYNDMIQAVKDEYSTRYLITSFHDGFVYLSKGFTLKINDRLCLSNAGIYINQLFMGESDQLSLEYYQSLSREQFIDILRNADLNYCMLASWPERTSIRFELALEGDNGVRFYIGDVNTYNKEHQIDYSYLRYDRNTDISGPAVNEYNMTKDRFEGREFTDDDGNLYTVNILAKKIEEIHNVDLLLEKDICPYTYSTQSEYPVARITKNNDLIYETMVRMYVEFLGTSLNTFDEAYCTGFSSELAINGECIRIDFNSGVDDDNMTWFQFDISRLFDYSNGSFQNYEMQSIKLYPIEDNRIPLAGNPKSKE